MTAELFGVVMALIALIGWGFGDFLIQRNARIEGTWKSLLWIVGIGTIVLTPFIADELPALLRSGSDLALMALVSVVLLAAAVLDFDALIKGKIAIIEPVLGLEVPVVVALDIIILNQLLAPFHLFLIGIVFLGIVLTVTEHHHLKLRARHIFERGALLALIAALLMGGVNFLVGVGGRETSPLMVMWFTNLFLALASLGVLIKRGQFSSMRADFKSHSLLISGMIIFDNMAWIAYAYATFYIPISIATAISESYIALSVLLGIYVNQEKVHRHQVAGIILAVSGVVILSALTA